MTDALPDDSNLLDYDEEDAEPEQQANGTVDKKAVKGTYVSIHSSGFRDFLLKPELLRAIVDCGFEHPSEGERLKNGKAAILFSLALKLFGLLHMQFKTSVYHKQFLAWMSSARQRVAWGRQLCLFFRPCSSWNQLMVKSVCW